MINYTLSEKEFKILAKLAKGKYRIIKILIDRASESYFINFERIKK